MSLVRNQSRGSILASHARTAQNAWQRMKGLLGRGGLPDGEALIIPHCQSIHMLFMKFPIDVVFCDQKDRVVGLCPQIRPFSLSPVFFKASYAIELPVRTIAKSLTETGDQLQIQT